ncbi:hypothetical protein Bbelb_367310 [Branchiostoma belcheri]|nr:hypothetical protein Bbelb_367310 [Branchiostoma belcheri]
MIHVLEGEGPRQAPSGKKIRGISLTYDDVNGVTRSPDTPTGEDTSLLCSSRFGRTWLVTDSNNGRDYCCLPVFFSRRKEEGNFNAKMASGCLEIALGDSFSLSLLRFRPHFFPPFSDHSVDNDQCVILKRAHVDTSGSFYRHVQELLEAYNIFQVTVVYNLNATCVPETTEAVPTESPQPPQKIRLEIKGGGGDEPSHTDAPAGDLANSGPILTVGGGCALMPHVMVNLSFRLVPVYKHLRRTE